MEEVKPGSFIYEHEDALPLDTCAEIIRLFEENPADQKQGITDGGLNLSVKVSTDLKIIDQPQWMDIDHCLFNSVGDMLGKFPEQNWMYGSDVTDKGYQIQRTNEGGFYKPHYDGNGPGCIDRQLVIVWYLNDLEPDGGGHTAFPNHGIEITPKAGKAVLFPPFWTHVHEGMLVTKGPKYIATTWVS